VCAGAGVRVFIIYRFSGGFTYRSAIGNITGMVTKKSPNAGAVSAPKTFSLNSVIRLTKLGAVNPKRPGTAAHALYAAYGKGNLTVGAYLNAVAKLPRRSKAGRVALAWDFARKFITVG
jgi:hypothetical protein